MIVITGARGFIGSRLVKHFNTQGRNDLILVDETQNDTKNYNLVDAKFEHLIDRSLFLPWFKENATSISFVFHLGARTDTTEQNVQIFNELNLNYSKSIFTICTQFQIPLVYASSAATYGDGVLGYSDQVDIKLLKALNPYGQSKLDFDLWVQAQMDQPPFWVGLKFFNVYGPNENHKGRMASVVYHSFHQIRATGAMKLFASHHPEYMNGEQARDFVYVKDLLAVMNFFFENQEKSGLYNLGTGKARTFNDLAKAVFKSLELEVNIGYIDTPADIRGSYQVFTQAEMSKLRSIGYTKDFTNLEEGIDDYVKNYLLQ